jgi:hypothetical protein
MQRKKTTQIVLSHSEEGQLQQFAKSLAHSPASSLPLAARHGGKNRLPRLLDNAQGSCEEELYAMQKTQQQLS